MGLVGMYEAALPPASNVNDRKKLLAFFSVWALLKKEVDAEFVAPLLPSWTNDEVIKFIGNYSKWFNSPVSGKYVLYHERFRTFVLQKLSRRQFDERNNAIIHHCQLALNERLNNEWERYALEHLSSHMLINAMESSDGSALKALAYDSKHWNRQIEISKDFEWSKSMLNEMMLWASQFHDDQFIECILYKIDLFYIEQNDAPRIIELISQNDIETALKRIEAFGGIDEDGIQRKFIIYMLCLFELTLLQSKDKVFPSKAIEALISHLVENLTVDDSVLSWSDFFSSYIIFQMACNWACNGIDYNRVYDYTKEWDSGWIPEKGPYTKLEFEVLTDCASGIKDFNSRSIALRRLAIELHKSGKSKDAIVAWEMAVDSTRAIIDDYNRAYSLLEISKEYMNYGLLDKAALIQKEALICAELIKDNSKKSSALFDLSLEMVKVGNLYNAEVLLQDSIAMISQGRFIRDSKVNVLVRMSSELAEVGLIEQASSILNDAFILANNFKEERFKTSSLRKVSLELAKQRRFDEALNCARSIGDEKTKCTTLVKISSEILKYGHQHDAEVPLKDSLKIARLIIDDEAKCNSLKSISSELYEQGKIEASVLLMKETLSLARSFSSVNQRSKVLREISSELSKRSQANESLMILKEAYSSACSINSELDRDNMLAPIAIDFAKQFNPENAIGSALLIHDENSRINVLKEISKEILKIQGNDDAILVLNEAVVSAKNLGNEYYRQRALYDVSLELMKLGGVKEASSVLQEALMKSRGVSDEYWKSNALKEVSSELIKVGRINEAYSFSQVIPSKEIRSKVLLEISNCFVKDGNLELAYHYARSIRDDSERGTALLDLSKEFVQHKFKEKALLIRKEALNSARLVNGIHKKRKILSDISLEFYKEGNSDEAHVILKEALSVSPSERYHHNFKVNVLCNISSELVRVGNQKQAALVLKEAYEYASGISEERFKLAALKNITLELAKQGNLENALSCARSINDDRLKLAALQSISSELKNQGLIDASYVVLKEALDYVRLLIDGETKCISLKNISSDFFENGRFETSELLMNETLVSARGISDLKQKCNVLNEISKELSKRGNQAEALIVLKESLSYAYNILLGSDRDKVILNISCEFVRQGYTQIAIECSPSIKNDLNQSTALRAISLKQFAEGQIEEASITIEKAINCICLIKDDNARVSELQKISMDIIKMGKSVLAEKTILLINRRVNRTMCWRDWALFMIESHGWESSLMQAKAFSSREAIFFYLQSLADIVSLIQLPDTCMKQVYQLMLEDYYSLEIILQKFAVQMIFLKEKSRDFTNRLNQTLNIQWALDIAAQFPIAETKSRLSTNLESWLHEIPDEDDREQIELWAKQVAKGKITEEEFGERVRELIV